MTEGTEGKVAAILSPTTLAINKGSDHGVAKGDYFWLYTVLGPFFDPDTKENLGTTWKVWGRVVVSIVERRFCVAETEYELRTSGLNYSLARLFGTTREQIELPINENQLTSWVTKIEVGCMAKLERRPSAVKEKKIAALPGNTNKALPPAENDLEIESAEYFYNLFPISGKTLQTTKGKWIIDLKSFEKLPNSNELHYTLSLKDAEKSIERVLHVRGYSTDFKHRSENHVLTSNAMEEALNAIEDWLREDGENSRNLWLFANHLDPGR